MTTVLIVEDDPFIHENLVIVIEDMGYTTISASDIIEAKTILQSSITIDILFTDIRLKTERLGGYEVARLGRSLRPMLHVLYTTGNSALRDVSALIVEDAHFLPKPYTETSLRNSLANLCAV